MSRYDATRRLAHVTLDNVRGRRLELGAAPLVDAWYLAHALIAAESIGAVETCLERSVEYAKERFTFGRPIGSYQAIKHELTEILRRLENARGLAVLRRVGARGRSGGVRPGGECRPLGRRPGARLRRPHDDQRPRGIGATWEHDAPLFFRRAQLSRRLLGGTGDATDRVAERTLSAAGT